MFLGSIFCCINYDTQCVELYQGSKKLGSYASSFSKTTNADLRSDPSLYTVEMRIRGNKVRVYSGAAYTLGIVIYTAENASKKHSCLTASR